MTTRRDVLRGLFAAAAASVVPALPPGTVDAMVEKFSGVLLNGQAPKAVGISPCANGWYRLIAHFDPPAREPWTQYKVDLDFSKLPGGGLAVGDGTGIDEAQLSWGGQYEGDANDYFFSCYFKPNGRTK